eukprot:8428623-Pyramimonas_sp.AAC.1
MDLSFENPWDKLRALKDLMYEVAEEVKTQIRARPADSLESKHLRALQALRGWRSGGTFAIDAAIRAYPQLQFHFPSGLTHGVNVDSLCQH